MIKNCVICGKEFEARGSTKTCEGECRKKRNTECKREYMRERMRELRNDPKYRERMREYMRELRNSPEYRDRKRERDRESYRKKQSIQNISDLIKKNNHKKTCIKCKTEFMGRDFQEVCVSCIKKGL